MRIKPEQLGVHLDKRGLPAVCLIGGDEPLQRGECVDVLRRTARAQGIDERLTFDAGARMDWQALAQSCGTLSLFSSRRLIELTVHEGKLGREGSDFVAEIAARPAGEDVYLLIAEKPDRTVQSGKWFKAVEQRGFVLLTMPVPIQQLPSWIQRRLRARGRSITPAAAELLADRVEGNLLAAAQEIEKLLLLTDATELDVAEISAAVLDSARYDLYATVDQALAGDATRTLRMVRGLRAEGVEALLVSWLLNRELRALAAMRAMIDQGRSQADTFAAHKVWDTRKAAITAVLRRHDCQSLARLLRDTFRLDAVIKGVEPGNAWDLIEWTLLQLARPKAS